ncbi:carbohydrate ABC transporter permease [Paenibacillus silagei]|uniref:Multiple sugar transport system permease protein/putative aldouronate transport system permease protein n=1 Tax=Paenibacillus silagei TaxID=1670801 RepID=A0ABS4NTL0_9BACL|nr:carbohydrate ABC transporter permease [Paenibacillus silagei]MBP2112806.1 multiple sugar transport system permease protein/putative aldouronate transport system permease protein [Paenibacillus silagei]
MSQTKFSTHPAADKVYYIISGFILTFILIAVSYPLIYVLSASFSSGNAVSSGQVLLWPVDFSLEGYEAVFKNKDIVRAYGNTFLYTALGTLVNVTVVMTCAYALSRPGLKGRGGFMFLFTFTMFFSGGLIPFYILMKDLHLINTMWVMVLPGALSVYNMIIARTFIQSSIPGELIEATSIDGCSDARFFFSFVLPLSKAVIAVITLFSAVGHWNAYFNALMYLNDRTLYPLQIILREILIMNQVDVSMIMDPELQVAKAQAAAVLKYSLIVVATVPILCVYPFIQKYFVKGVMIGSLKG